MTRNRKLTVKKVFRSPFDMYSVTIAGLISPADIVSLN